MLHAGVEIALQYRSCAEAFPLWGIVGWRERGGNMRAHPNIPRCL
jgi:hypothetical protein